MTAIDRALRTKVPAVSLGFWVMKILATTLVAAQIAALANMKEHKHD